MRGFHEECYGPPCTGKQRVSEVPPVSTQGEEELTGGEAVNREAAGSTRPVARRTKPDRSLKDQQSTGRKRAARLYPLDRNAPCEWLGKVRQGGGDNPIAGCFDGKQLARHHGPDKNTLNNEPGNVHRICNHCHNRWHAKNDPDYDPNKPLKD